MDHDPLAVAKPLVFQGVLTEEDVIAIWRYADRLQDRRWLGYLVVGFAVIVTVVVVWTFVLHRLMGLGTPWYLQAAFALTVLVWAFPLVFRDSWVSWLARRHYRRNADRYLKTEVILGTERVTITNEVHRSELSWSLVGLVAATPEGLIFCNEARQPIFWLPDRVLEGEDLRSDVLALAEASGVGVRNVE